MTVTCPGNCEAGAAVLEALMTISSKEMTESESGR
jgi:hypothetical protein